MTRINIKRKNCKELESQAKKAFCKEPVMDNNTIDETKYEKIKTSEGTVYAKPEDLKSMEHSVCDFNQDSVSDAKESRASIELVRDIEASKEFGKAIAGKRLLEKKENDKKCVEAYKSIIDRAGDILKGLGRGKEITKSLEEQQSLTEDARTARETAHLGLTPEELENAKAVAESIQAVKDNTPKTDIEAVQEMVEKKRCCRCQGIDDIPEDLSNFYNRCRPSKTLDWNEAVKNRVTEPIEVEKDTTPTEDGEMTPYEFVNHPQHYNNYDMEVIDMMVRLFGVHETVSFCKLNAFKYRMRAGTKPGETAEQDIKKEQWYLRKAEELDSRLF